MGMRAIVWVVAAAALAGCAGFQTSSTATTYIRANGQPVSQAQIEADQASCATAGESTDRCMVEKGYFAVLPEYAEAKQAQLAQIAAENKKREAAELRKQEALERAARRQAKKKPQAN
jgi:aconitase A